MLSCECGAGWEHHDQPAEFWPVHQIMHAAPSTEIQDVFWASELRPVIARLENPQAQRDASEFFIHLWERGGCQHEFDTTPRIIKNFHWKEPVF